MMMPIKSENAFVEQQQKTKITKVRRTRQPRNPQLSVARRNERERNRVKMVNNGFALLRDHLPIEYLQATCGQESGSDTPDPIKQSGTQVAASSASSSKNKKFSKVETLRAAIQHIRMLEQLMRESEPAFESMNITVANRPNSTLMYDDEPLSVGEPLSQCSSSSNHSSTATTYQMQQAASASIPIQMYANLQQQQQQEQFVKLEPQQHQQISPANLSSPHHQPADQLDGLNQNQTAQYTQVHYTTNDQHHLQQQPSHTHLWLQQHQSSFMEQQQQSNWYNGQQQQQHNQEAPKTPMDTQSWQYQIQQQQVATDSSPSPQQMISPAQQHHNHHHQQQQQYQQMDSPPIWFTNSPSGSSIVQMQSPAASVNSQQQQHPIVSSFNQHQQNQISLYSQ